MLRVTLVMFATLLVTQAENAVTASEQIIDSGDRAAALRELEMRQLRLQLYVRSEYPLERRRLDTEIKLAEAQIGIHAREAAEFEKIQRYNYGQPFRVTVDNARYAELVARTRLADLKEEKRILEAGFRNRCRLLELDVEAAQATLDRMQTTVGIEHSSPPAPIAPPRYVEHRPTRSASASALRRIVLARKDSP